jgi:hypothetical protein
MEKIKRHLKPLILLGILLVAAGCTNTEVTGDDSEGTVVQSEAEQNIEAVLENIFTGPNEEQSLMFESDEDVKRKAERLDEYYQESFKPYLSERFLEGFINNNGGIQFLIIAHPNYVLETEEISLEVNDDYYTFAAKVVYTNKESGESETITVNGNAQTDEEGKVTSIQYHTDEYKEFRSALE